MEDWNHDGKIDAMDYVFYEEFIENHDNMSSTDAFDNDFGDDIGSDFSDDFDDDLDGLMSKYDNTAGSYHYHGSGAGTSTANQRRATNTNTCTPPRTSSGNPIAKVVRWIIIFFIISLIEAASPLAAIILFILWMIFEFTIGRFI